MKEIIFAHYRVGERDGVSLEIEKRAKVAKELGCSVKFVTGVDFLKREESYVIDEFNPENEKVKALQDVLFENPTVDESSAQKMYRELEDEIYKKLDKLFSEEKIDFLFAHNMLSHAFNLAASTALLKALDKFRIKTDAVDHDFWFEREKFSKSKYGFVNKILEDLPPKRDYITHQVINSISQGEVEKRKHIKAKKIGDYFDFEQKPCVIDEFNRDFYKEFGIGQNDIVILQATRVIQRKAIDNAMFFTKCLKDNIGKMDGLEINGKKISKDSNVVLFISNFVELDSYRYFEDLKKLSQDLGIKVIWGQDKISLKRDGSDGSKKYSFWDPYVFADIVSYPSLLEGFGNQFLEAVYYKKPVVIFEYPVFKKDLKSEGYDVISLGSKTEKRNGFNLVPQKRIQEAVDETIELFKSQDKVSSMTENNFRIAQKYHDVSLLKEDIKDLIAK